MTPSSNPAPLTNAEKLSREIQKLKIPREIIKPGWLLAAYLRNEDFISVPDTPQELTQLLSTTFRLGHLRDLSIDEFEKLLTETEKIYPKFRA
ncbi:MAG: hypothetical protein U9M89_01810 [Patescibacteria group bacterium]|nr:hypothetical protein [Patescibacteria group bacterium]